MKPHWEKMYDWRIEDLRDAWIMVCACEDLARRRPCDTLRDILAMAGKILKGERKEYKKIYGVWPRAGLYK